MDYRVVHLRSTACLVVRTSGQADPREQNASSPWSQRPALVQYLGLIHIPDRAGGAAAGDPGVSCVSTQREQECHCPNAQCEGQEQSATRGTPAGRRRYPEPLPIRRTRRRRVRRDHRPRTRLSPLPPRAAVDTADGLSFIPGSIVYSQVTHPLVAPTRPQVARGRLRWELDWSIHLLVRELPLPGAWWRVRRRQVASAVHASL